MPKLAIKFYEMDPWSNTGTNHRVGVPSRRGPPHVTYINTMVFQHCNLPGNNSFEISDSLQGQVHVQLDHVASIDQKDVQHFDRKMFGWNLCRPGYRSRIFFISYLCPEKIIWELNRFFVLWSIIDNERNIQWGSEYQTSSEFK